MTVTTDDNILPLIETTVEGDSLRIGGKGSYSTRLGVRVKVSVPALTGAAISGSGKINAKGLKTDQMDATVTGSGDITLEGTTGSLRGEITGSGKLQAKELAAKAAHVKLTGSGDAIVQVSASLEASVTGSGNIYYSGNPAKVLKSVTGSGAIEPR